MKFMGESWWLASKYYATRKSGGLNTLEVAVSLYGVDALA